MHLMTNKNTLHTIRMMVLVMLFQLFSPVAFALISDSKETGRFATLCTLQGYKQVWMESAAEQKDVETTELSCPYCLLNIGALDAINSNTKYPFDFSNDFSNDFLVVQNKAQSKVLLSSLSIRAPPCFS